AGWPFEPADVVLSPSVAGETGWNRNRRQAFTKNVSACPAHPCGRRQNPGPRAAPALIKPTIALLNRFVKGDYPYTFLAFSPPRGTRARPRERALFVCYRTEIGNEQRFPQ